MLILELFFAEGAIVTIFLPCQEVFLFDSIHSEKYLRHFIPISVTKSLKIKYK